MSDNAWRTVVIQAYASLTLREGSLIITSENGKETIPIEQIKEILDSLDSLNQNAKKQNDIIERLNIIDEENSNLAETLSQTISSSAEKVSKLNSLSNNIKNSAIEG